MNSSSSPTHNPGNTGSYRQLSDVPMDNLSSASNLPSSGSYSEIKEREVKQAPHYDEVFVGINDPEQKAEFTRNQIIMRGAQVTILDEQIKEKENSFLMKISFLDFSGLSRFTLYVLVWIALNAAVNTMKKTFEDRADGPDKDGAIATDALSTTLTSAQNLAFFGAILFLEFVVGSIYKREKGKIHKLKSERDYLKKEKDDFAILGLRIDNEKTHRQLADLMARFNELTATQQGFDLGSILPKLEKFAQNIFIRGARSGRKHILNVQSQSADKSQVDSKHNTERLLYNGDESNETKERKAQEENAFPLLARLNNAIDSQPMPLSSATSTSTSSNSALPSSSSNSFFSSAGVPSQGMAPISAISSTTTRASQNPPVDFMGVTVHAPLSALSSATSSKPPQSKEDLDLLSGANILNPADMLATGDLGDSANLVLNYQSTSTQPHNMDLLNAAVKSKNTGSSSSAMRAPGVNKPPTPKFNINETSVPAMKEIWLKGRAREEIELENLLRKLSHLQLRDHQDIQLLKRQLLEVYGCAADYDKSLAKPLSEFTELEKILCLVVTAIKTVSQHVELTKDHIMMAFALLFFASHDNQLRLSGDGDNLAATARWLHKCLGVYEPKSLQGYVSILKSYPLEGLHAIQLGFHIRKLTSLECEKDATLVLLLNQLKLKFQTPEDYDLPLPAPFGPNASTVDRFLAIAVQAINDVVLTLDVRIIGIRECHMSKDHVLAAIALLFYAEEALMLRVPAQEMDKLVWVARALRNNTHAFNMDQLQALVTLMRAAGQQGFNGVNQQLALASIQAARVGVQPVVAQPVVQPAQQGEDPFALPRLEEGDDLDVSLQNKMG